MSPMSRQLTNKELTQAAVLARQTPILQTNSCKLLCRQPGWHDPTTDHLRQLFADTAPGHSAGASNGPGWASEEEDPEYAPKQPKGAKVGAGWADASPASRDHCNISALSWLGAGCSGLVGPGAAQHIVNCLSSLKDKCILHNAGRRQVAARLVQPHQRR